ncbi:MAG: hypothetical protein K0S61_1796 [Anaerocolumna sp.]|jgi:hypothetical protein|nr:hypothetical protein [Anaerocolumna sp.]
MNNIDLTPKSRTRICLILGKFYYTFRRRLLWNFAKVNPFPTGNIVF